MLMTEFKIPDKEVFSAREVGRLLGVSNHTINTAIEKGSISTVQALDVLGNPLDRRAIPRSEVERLARQKGLLP